jgi:hypothetical protein
MIYYWTLVLSGVLALNLANAGEVGGNDLLPPIVIEKQFLGRRTSVESRASSISTESGISNSLAVTMLGRSASLVDLQASPLFQANSLPESVPPGTPLAQTNLYIHGIKVWGGELRYGQGGLHYSGGIAPTQIPFPILTYPLGPVLLKLDAGIEFEGRFDASLVPGISIPITDSTLQAKLSGDLGASGFVEGYGSVYLARAGIEGRVDLVDGKTGLETLLNFIHVKPKAKAFGRITFLRGALEGFLDLRVSFLRWRRLISRTFFSWPGKCFSFGSESCD